MPSLYDMSTDDLKKLYDLKTNYGSADAQTRLSLGSQGNALRSQYGIAEDKATADDVKSILDQKTAQPQTTGYIQSLADSQRQANQAALDKAYQANQSTLTAEKQQIAPEYYNKRNDTNASSQLGARNLAEYMANRGQTNSGSAVQAEISRQGNLQGSINNLNVSEANANSDVMRRMSNLGTAYQADTVANTQGVQAQMMQNLLNQYNTDRDYGLNVAGLTGVLNGQQTLAGKTYDLNAQGQYFNQGMANKQYDLSAQNQTFNQGMATKQFDEAVRQNNLAQTNWQQQFTYQQAKYMIQNQINQWQLSIQQGNLALQQAKLAADQDPNSLDNQIKAAQLQGINKETALMGTNTTDYTDIINKMYSNYNNQTGNYNMNTNGISNYIDGLVSSGQIDSNTANYYRSYYGLGATGSAQTLPYQAQQSIQQLPNQGPAPNLDNLPYMPNAGVESAINSEANWFINNHGSKSEALSTLQQYKNQYIQELGQGGYDKLVYAIQTSMK